MGLFDDYDIDIDEVKEAGGFDFDDDTYEFEISEALRQNGTKNDPDDTKFIIKYDLDEAGTYWEWFTLAVDGDATHRKAKQSLEYLKSRLLDLGLKASELSSFEPEDLEGITGSLKLVTTKKNGNSYQNVRNVKVFETEDEPEDEPEEKPAAKRSTAAKQKADDAAAKKRVAERRAAREAEEKPAAKRTTRSRAKASDDEDEENPFG